MPYIWKTFLNEALAGVVTAVPEVRQNGLFEFDEVVRTSWDSIGGYPYVVFDVIDAVAADWGLVNVALEILLEIHLVCQESFGIANVRDRLERIKNNLFIQSFTAATLLELVSMDWSGSHPANRVFYDKNVNFVSGVATFRFVVGETAR